nr:hypothetical protein [Tanacetum cinerariifolium]
MAAGQRKPEGQWTGDERKAANLDERPKSLIMSVLLDDQMNSVINCLTAKSTWDDLILYHEDFQDSHDDDEDTRSCHEYLNDLEEEYQARALLAKSKRFFKEGTQRFSSAKATDQTGCQKCGKKVTEVNALMALANEERVSVGKESAKNDEWIKIYMKKCISEQIPTQKKKILEIDQLTKDTSSSRPKDPVFIKSSADNSEVSFTGSNKPKLSEVEDSTMSNHDTAPARGNKSFPSSKTNSAPAEESNLETLNMSKNYETCGRNVHTTSDHNDIEWFRKSEALEAKKVESFKASKTQSSSALKLKTPTKKWVSKQN